MRTNVRKIVGMVFRPFQAAGNQLEVAYVGRITGEGPTYREKLKGRVSCRECGYMMSAGSLASHLMTQHGRVTETRRIWRTLSAGAGTRKFRMAFPAKGGLWSCPVEGCTGRAATRTEMRVHFLQHNVLETMVILEEGNLSHPLCTRCNMLFPWRYLNVSHPATSQCARGGGAEEGEACGGRDEGDIIEGL